MTPADEIRVEAMRVALLCAGAALRDVAAKLVEEAIRIERFASPERVSRRRASRRRGRISNVPRGEP